MTVGVRHSEMGALLGFAERQLYVYKRYWVWEVVWLFYSTVSVLLAAMAIFNLACSHANVPGALVVLAAAIVPLIGLAILTSVLPLLSPQKGEQMSFAVQGFLLLVSGVYYPLSVLPVPLQL